MSHDDGDFTDPASRVDWGKARAPFGDGSPPREAAGAGQGHARPADLSRDVPPGALLVLIGIAAGVTWWVFGDWNAAPEVPGFNGFSTGRIVLPAIDVVLLAWFALRVLAGAEAARGVSPNVVRVGLVLLLAGFAALEGTGTLRRTVLAQWGSVPGGPTWEQNMDTERLLLEKQLPAWVGVPQEPAFFDGTWRRIDRVMQNDVRRLEVRRDGAGFRVRVWHECEPGQAPCDAGEVLAGLTRADGRIASLSVQVEIPDGRIWFLMGPGKAAARPGVIVTQVLVPDRPEKRVSSGVGAVLVRETPGLPLVVAAQPPASAAGISRDPATVQAAAPGGAPAPPAATSCAAARTLHEAAGLGCTETIGPLIAAQADQLEARNRLGQTPLALAVLRNQHDAAERLLKVGADANALIRFAAGARPNASGLQRAQQPELAEGSTPLIMARDAAMVALLLRFGADPRLKNDYGWSALFYFTHHGSVEMLDTLLGAGAEVNDTAVVDPSHAGSTPLMWAAYMNRSAHLQVLLKYKARLDMRDRAGKTALDYARGFGHQEPIRLLTAK